MCATEICDILICILHSDCRSSNRFGKYIHRGSQLIKFVVAGDLVEGDLAVQSESIGLVKYQHIEFYEGGSNIFELLRTVPVREFTVVFTVRQGRVHSFISRAFTGKQKENNGCKGKRKA